MAGAVGTPDEGGQQNPVGSTEERMEAAGELEVQRKVFGFFTVCAVVMIATGLAVPMTPIMSFIGGVSAAEDTTPSVLRIGFMEKIDNLNPYIGVGDAAYVFYGLVYDTLDVINNTAQQTPSIAKGIWTVPISDPYMQENNLPYGSVWQYNLTTKANYSDGEPVTADDVVWNINLNSSPLNYTTLWAFQPYAYFMQYAWKVDKETVRILFYDRETKQPIPAAYPYLCSIYILPRHMMKSMSASTIGFKWTGVFNNSDQPIVGTGPFIASPTIYTDWLAGNTITLTKNPDYFWGPEYGKYVQFDQVQLKFYDDTMAMQYALVNNELDAAQFPPSAFRNLESDVAAGKVKNLETYSGPKITQYWVEIGICAGTGGGNPSRDDPVVKKALAMATNKQYIVDNFYFGLGDVGSTMIPPINPYWHYEPTAAETYNFDLTAAAKLLQDNGYIDINSDNLREATAASPSVKNHLVAVNTTMSYEMIIRSEYPEEYQTAQWLATQWAQIGVEIRLKKVDEATLNSIVYTYNYDMMIWYWSSDVDPNYQLFAATSMAIGGWNDIKYNNPQYDYNYTMSVMSMDKTTRKTYVDNCQKIMYDDSNYIIMVYPYQTYAWRTDTFSGWGDWKANPARSLDNFWSGNPLYFDLIPHEVKPTTIPVLYIAIGGIAVAAVVGAVIALRYRGKKGGEEGKEETSPLGD